MATIKCPMANIVSPVAKIRLPMAEITSRYGENYSGMAKALWRAIAMAGAEALRRRLLFSLRLLLHSASALAQCAGDHQAQSEPTAQPRVAPRCSSVVRYWFNGSIIASMNSNNCPASPCLALAIDRGGYRLSAGPVVAAQEHRKQFRSQIGGDNVLGTTGASAGVIGRTAGFAASSDRFHQHPGELLNECLLFALTVPVAVERPPILCLANRRAARSWIFEGLVPTQIGVPTRPR